MKNKTDILEQLKILAKERATDKTSIDSLQRSIKILKETAPITKKGIIDCMERTLDLNRRIAGLQ